MAVDSSETADAYIADVEAVIGIIREYLAPELPMDDQFLEDAGGHIVLTLFGRWYGVDRYDSELTAAHAAAKG